MRDDGPGIRVRPYAITGGRTRGKTDIPIETIVVPTAPGREQAPRMSMERGQILRLCATPMSVAEISAHLHIALGVARVLVGDMVDEGLVDFNRSHAKGERPSLRLLERVFDGLQAL
ncbi:MAG: DUF742 domain-containing protein [Actinobacteria bacterium]|nr:DUF742 domain-containing protein [Actinomycetota bacterium]